MSKKFDFDTVTMTFRWDFSSLPNFLNKYIEHKGEIGSGYDFRKNFSSDECIMLDIDDVAYRHEDYIEHLINLPHYSFNKVKIGQNDIGQAVICSRFMYLKVSYPLDKDAYLEKIRDLFLDQFLVGITDTKGLTCICECITKQIQEKNYSQVFNMNYFSQLQLNNSMIINGRYSDEYNIDEYENCLIRTIRNFRNLTDKEDNGRYEVAIKNILFRGFDNDLPNEPIDVFNDMIDKSKSQIMNCFHKE